MTRYFPLITYDLSDMYSINTKRFVDSNEQNCSTVKRTSTAEKYVNNTFIKLLWIATYHFIVAWQNTFLHRNYSTPAPHYPAAKLLDLLGFQPLHHTSSVSLTNPDPIPTHHLHFPLLITIPTFIEPHILHPAAPSPL